MAVLCEICGWPVEPSEVALQTQTCGYCAGRIPQSRQICYDLAPCTREDQDCRQCEHLGTTVKGGAAHGS